MRKWSDVGIKKPARSGASFKTTCPKCSVTRVKDYEFCLSCDELKEKDTPTGTLKGAWNCHHCGWSGWLNQNSEPSETFKWERVEYVLPAYEEEGWELSETALGWFKGRGISEATLRANRVGSQVRKWRDNHGTYRAETAAMPYTKNGEIVQVQLRNLDQKEFKFLTRHAEVIMAGLDNVIEDGVVATKKLVIVEGWLDLLSLYESGFKYVLSVPNGSPYEEEGKPPKNPSLDFLNDSDVQRILEYVDEVVIAGDDDHQGRRLTDELARRIGVHKCLKVEYPKGCKDINDVLVQHGTKEVITSILAAKAFPVQGIVHVMDVRERLLSLYDTGVTPGMSLGLGESVDKIFTVKEGYYTTWTGVPTVGKTTLLRNVGINLAEKYGIHITEFTPESWPVEYHISRLAQLYLRKRFGRPGEKNRMTKEELEEAIKWVHKHYSFVLPESRKIEDILRLTKMEISKNGTKLLIIDPFNHVTRDPLAGVEWVSDLLSEILNFCRVNEVHTIQVVHPTKMEENEKTGEYPVVKPYNLYGSSHWFNKSDNIVSLWRSMKNPNWPLRFYTQKGKIEEAAKEGMALLKYNGSLQRYEGYEGPKDIPVEDYEDEEESRVEERDDKRYNGGSAASRAASRRRISRSRKDNNDDD